MNRLERLAVRHFKHAVQFRVIQQRIGANGHRRLADRAGRDALAHARHVGQRDGLEFAGNLSDDALADAKLLGQQILLVKGERAAPRQNFFVRVIHIQRAMPGANLPRNQAERLLADLIKRQIAGNFQAQLIHAVFHPILLFDGFQRTFDCKHFPQVRNHALHRKIERVLRRFRLHGHVQFLPRNFISHVRHVLNIGDHALHGAQQQPDFIMRLGRKRHAQIPFGHMIRNRHGGLKRLGDGAGDDKYDHHCNENHDDGHDYRRHQHLPRNDVGVFRKRFGLVVRKIRQDLHRLFHC